MRYYWGFLLVVFSFANAQQNITLDDIFNQGTFGAKGMEAFQAMQNGDFYTLLNADQRGTRLDKYNYATLEKVSTLVDSQDLPIPYFDSYLLSDDESKVILGTESESIFRHSEIADYYVFEFSSKKLTKIAESKIQEPTFSPDGLKVAFAFNNNLYVKFLSDGKIIQITSDGEYNKIINGVTDWVYEEEFSFVRAFDWNKNSDKIAFIRFDESQVPEYSMDIYGKDLYQKQLVFKYPKAGENNSSVSMHLFDLNTKKTQKLNLGTDQQYYIPRIKWTQNPDVLSITTLNRHQNNLNLIFHDTKTNNSKVVLNEKDAAYVEINDDLTFLEDNSFIWPSERDGFNHLYLYDHNGKLKNQITQGSWEVTSYYGFDTKRDRILYQSTEEGSVNRSIYSIAPNGKKKVKLSDQLGTNAANFSSSFGFYVNTFSNTKTPTLYTLNDGVTGKVLKEIVNNDVLKAKIKAYNVPEKELSVLKTSTGDFNMWMMKPNNFDPNKKYPLFMYQCSGPGSQQVSNSWFNYRDYYHAMLAQQGIIIAVVDGRGTGLKGRDFKKITYKELGKYEIIDQIEAAKELGKLAYIDQNRIGIWGWSYGGYMSSLAITKGADVFKMAIAVAPVTSWRFYDSVYTERYMQTPQENAGGYDQNSPLNFANLLKGDYLLIHGTGDDNVHVQNSMRMANALIEANKDFEYFVYPDRSHGIYEGKNTRIHLYEKMTKFIEKNL